jgi:hypothetical protein
MEAFGLLNAEKRQRRRLREDTEKTSNGCPLCPLSVLSDLCVEIQAAGGGVLGS